VQIIFGRELEYTLNLYRDISCIITVFSVGILQNFEVFTFEFVAVYSPHRRPHRRQRHHWPQAGQNWSCNCVLYQTCEALRTQLAQETGNPLLDKRAHPFRSGHINSMRNGLERWNPNVPSGAPGYPSKSPANQLGGMTGLVGPVGTTSHPFATQTLLSEKVTRWFRPQKAVSQNL
jgi:hypothetical protein